jgi:hypothetical protein
MIVAMVNMERIGRSIAKLLGGAAALNGQTTPACGRRKRLAGVTAFRAA